MSTIDTAGPSSLVVPDVLPGAASGPDAAPAAPAAREVAAPAAPAAREVAATSSFTELGGILLRGFGLTLVTLGIYRFWMKTNIRRWYWANTVIGGDALEYRGTGRELFIGFLFAIGILLPFYAVIVGATYFSGLLSWEVGSNLFLVLMAGFAQFAAYRARRYRLTRTVWRGLTFAQDGSGWTFAGRWFVALAVTIATLGFAFPWGRAFLESYRVRHTRFGSAEGAFAPRLARPVITWCILWAPALIAVGIGFALAYRYGGLDSLWQIALIFAGISETTPETMGPELAETAIWVGTGVGGALLWGLLLWPAYKTEEFRAFTDGTRIGPVGFKSSVQKSWYYSAGLRFVLAFALVLCVLGFGLYILARQTGNFLDALDETGTTVLIFVFYLVLAISFVILRELILVQGFWRHALSTLTVSGLDQTSEIIARGQQDRAVGEGLADAFELGGF